jgi:hypothetical protein
MTKTFKLSAGEIKRLVDGYGGCYASDKITVDGYPVRFMYREHPDQDADSGWCDSGWRFMSGFEDDEYTGNADNFAIYNVNTIANYDPSIIPFLDAPAGSSFEKPLVAERFVEVSGWTPADS